MREFYEEKVMSDLRKRITSEEYKDQIDFWGMEDFQISEFKNLITIIKRNEAKDKFPDFVGNNGFAEVFKITSSIETKEKGVALKKGSQYVLEKIEFDKKRNCIINAPLSLEEQKSGRAYTDTFTYKNHSHENFLKSLENNIDHHVKQYDKYNSRGGKSLFLAYYEETVLSYRDDLGIEKWYKIASDNKALMIIKCLLAHKIDYFVLFNPENIEVILVNEIDKIIDSHGTHQKEYYPREGAGQLTIAIMDSAPTFELKDIGLGV